jgi:hypothetical protein
LFLALTAKNFNHLIRGIRKIICTFIFFVCYLFPVGIQFFTIAFHILRKKQVKGYYVAIPMAGRTSGRSEHDRKLHVLISAEIRDHKLAGQTLLLA